MVLLLVSKCPNIKVNFKIFKRVLQDIYDFEKEVNFNSNLADKFFDIPNKLILRKQFTLTILYFKLFNLIKKITVLRKINRLIHKVF